MKYDYFFKIISNILKKDFKIKKINLKSDLTKIKNWDSLKHLDFIMSLEKTFKVKFNINENFQIKTVENFLKKIIDKTNKLK